jgi:hypothetical protein
VSKRRYPRLGYDGGNIPRDAACKVCGTTERVWPQAVQVNWFRGDDDVHPVCRTCKRQPEPELLAKLGYRVKSEVQS